MEKQTDGVMTPSGLKISEFEKKKKKTTTNHKPVLPVL